MKRKASGNLFQASNTLKVLAYMLDRPGQEVLPNDILEATALSRVGIYLALRKLLEQKFIIKVERGWFVSYTVAHSNPVVKQFKVMGNILILMPVLERLRLYAKKVVLFGSTSRGEDYPDSDIDLFVLSQDPEGAVEALSKTKLKRKIQAIIKTPSEYAEFKEKNQTFQKEIERGIILWEEKA
jgi:predicted nucleotidyltransferase